VLGKGDRKRQADRAAAEDDDLKLLNSCTPGQRPGPPASCLPALI
jgi:hypothetical protein